jgi:hypothetical protein
MRIYGYEDTGRSPDQLIPATLAEVTLNASPSELRAIAAFLVECADEMDHMGPRFDHVHLADRVKSFASSPHFVVARE